MPNNLSRFADEFVPNELTERLTLLLEMIRCAWKCIISLVKPIVFMKTPTNSNKQWIKRFVWINECLK